MTTSFKQSITPITPITPFIHTGSIPHIESVPTQEFIDVIKNLSNYTITEKIDGNNLIFGYDNQGMFYTSREAKGGERYYSPSDYPLTAANNIFRSAHVALTKHPFLKNQVGVGNQVECEILYGRQPNAVVYGDNHITFLRGIPGDNGKNPEEDLLERLKQQVCGCCCTVDCKKVVSYDGSNVDTVTDQPIWNFSATKTIDPNCFDIKKLNNQIEKLEKLLNTEVYDDCSVRYLLDINLNKIQASKRDQFKKKRDQYNELVTKHKLQIKDTLLKTLREYTPHLRTTTILPEAGEIAGIEGVVLLCKETHSQYKIVDKDEFTAINKFNFAIRNQIKATSQVGKQSKKLLSGCNDVYGTMLQSISKRLGCEELGDYMNITRFLKANKGKQVMDTIDNVITHIPNKDVNVIVDICDAISNLDKLRREYLQKWEDLEYMLPDKRKIKYSESTHARTLLFFAEVNQELMCMLKAIQSSQSIQETIMILFSKQLQNIHQVS